MPRSEKLITLDLEIRFRTAKAFGFQTDKQRDLVWCPQSLVEDNGDGTFTMPEWLVIDKGLESYAVSTR